MEKPMSIPPYGWEGHKDADKSVLPELLSWLLICYLAYKIGRIP